mgnify:CR=1 FL=1
MKHINLKESKKWKVLILMIVLSFVFLSLYAVAQGIVSIIEPLLPFVVACLLLGSLLLTLSVSETPFKFRPFTCTFGEK